MGALATLGIAAGSTLLGSYLDKRAQDRAFEQNKQFWHERFDKEAQYNSPVQQKARMMAAGLNPALMYKGGQTGGSVTGGSAQGKIAERYQLTELAKMSAEVDAIRKNTEKVEAEKSFIEAKTTGQGTLNEKAVVDLAKAEIEKMYLDDKQKAGLDKLVAEAAKAMTEADTAAMKKEIFEGVNKKAYDSYGINLENTPVSMLLQAFMVGGEKTWDKANEFMNWLEKTSKDMGAWPGMNPLNMMMNLAR